VQLKAIAPASLLLRGTNYLISGKICSKQINYVRPPFHPFGDQTITTSRAADIPNSLRLAGHWSLPNNIWASGLMAPFAGLAASTVGVECRIIQRAHTNAQVFGVMIVLLGIAQSSKFVGKTQGVVLKRGTKHFSPAGKRIGCETLASVE